MAGVLGRLRPRCAACGSQKRTGGVTKPKQNTGRLKFSVAWSERGVYIRPDEGHLEQGWLEELLPPVCPLHPTLGTELLGLVAGFSWGH